MLFRSVFFLPPNATAGIYAGVAVAVGGGIGAAVALGGKKKTSP